MSSFYKSQNTIYIMAFVFLLALSSLLFFSEKARRAFLFQSHQPKRKIIATIESDLSNQGNKYKILKVLTSEGIFIEIYDSNSNYNKVAVFALANKHDGHLSIEGKSTNLALKDLDGDQVTEIIAPSFSNDQKPSVHIFKFNLPLLTFEEITHLDLPIGS